MKRFIYPSIQLIFILFFLSLSSCKKEDNPLETNDTNGTSGKIETGTLVEISTTPINSGGGTIKVSKPGAPIDGLEITIPPNSFSTTKNFKISYADIKGHQFGQYFNPISPMITVSYEGGYSNDAMRVKIPIQLPAGHFAMGFLYDVQTGKLEGMPIESLDNNFITVDTRNFSSANAQLNKQKGIFETTSVGNLIISSISESVLNGKSIISTGFKPGVDDWEFINDGSYLEYEGHCAGQSISAMWYYYEKKLNGAPKLFHRFDKYFIQGQNGDSLWMDNRNGFRFASMVQNSIDWSGMIRKIFLKWRENPNYHFLSWRAFALSMLVTGEPQYVGLEGVEGAHAIIAHKISLTENLLYVTDPNFPGQERTIKYNGNTFDPYSTKQNTKDPVAHPYTGIGYFSKSSLIDWSLVSQLYSDLENGISGDNKFPVYSLLIKKGTVISDFNDGVVLDKDTLTIINRSTACLQAITGTDHYQFISVYDTTGKKLASSSDAGKKGLATLKLKPGANKLGLYIMGARNNVGNNYVDFKWVTVYYRTLSIEPNPLAGEPNKEYVFKALTKKTAPASAKYVWTFGDNSPQVTKQNDSTVAHSYTNEGDFTVKVELYDNSNNNKIGEAISQAQIRKPGSSKSFSFSWVENHTTWWPRFYITFNISGTVEGVNGNSVVEITDNQYQKGLVHVNFSDYGAFKINFNGSFSVSPTKVDTTYSDGSYDVFTFEGNQGMKWFTSNFVPYTFEATSGGTYENSNSFGSISIWGYMDTKLERYDKNKILYDTTTGPSTWVLGSINFDKK